MCELRDSSSITRLGDRITYGLRQIFGPARLARGPCPLSLINRIVILGHNDGNRARCLLRSARVCRARRDDNIDFETD
jgi:hypothetical protein